MTTPRQKPGWVFWAVVGLAFPVLYVGSFGPALWSLSRVRYPTSDAPSRFLQIAYRPLLVEIVDGTGPVSRLLHWYGSIGTKRDDTKDSPFGLWIARDGAPRVLVFESAE